MNRAKHPLYMRHYHMMRRCYSEGYPGYDQAGGRGLDVYEGWHDMDTFFQDIEDICGLPTNSWSQLARIDNDRGWYPDNIAGWYDHKAVARNRQDNFMITFHGKTQPLAKWAEETGLHPSTIWNRIHNGWDIDDAMLLPPNKQQRVKK